MHFVLNNLKECYTLINIVKQKQIKEQIFVVRHVLKIEMQLKLYMMSVETGNKSKVFTAQKHVVLKVTSKGTQYTKLVPK